MCGFLSVLSQTRSEAAKDAVIQATAGGFSTMGAAFVQESIGHMIPWLIVTFAVIVCDLVCGIRKSICLGEDVRFSKAVRRTLGKTVVYFSFVVMICMVDVASGGGRVIDRWACLTVCFIEGCSIISNILATKGIKVNVINAFALFLHRAFSVDKDDVRDVLEEDGKEDK